MSDEPIQPGYKRTEIGVIPENWEVKKFDQIADVDPENLSASTDPGYAFRYISLEDVDRGTLRSYTEQVFCTAPSRARRVIRKGDVLVSTVRPNLKSHLYIKQEVFNNVCSTGFSVLRCKSCVSDPALIFFHLFAGIIEKQIESLLAGSNYPAINSRDVKALRIPFPPDGNEQVAIAEALSDVDALLDALDRLIAKKRALKQGAMQALLTGRVRLPGFRDIPGYKRTELGVIPEDWVIRTLGEVTDSLDHLRVPLNEKQRAAMPGPYPYCGANGVLDFIGDYILDADVILMAEDGGYFEEFATRPIAYRMSGKIWVNNHVHILQAKIGVDQGYLFYSIVHKNILPYISSGTRSKLNKGELVKIEVALPGAEREQVAIAEVLSDMDAEIGALEQRRAKLRDIKQGMMQELLTGRIRLVQPQASAQEAHV